MTSAACAYSRTTPGSPPMSPKGSSVPSCMIVSRMALMRDRTPTRRQPAPEFSAPDGVTRAALPGRRYRTEGGGGDDAMALRRAGGACPTGGTGDGTAGAGAMRLDGAVLGRRPVGMLGAPAFS